MVRRVRRVARSESEVVRRLGTEARKRSSQASVAEKPPFLRHELPGLRGGAVHSGGARDHHHGRLRLLACVDYLPVPFNLTVRLTLPVSLFHTSSAFVGGRRARASTFVYLLLLPLPVFVCLLTG